MQQKSKFLKISFFSFFEKFAEFRALGLLSGYWELERRRIQQGNLPFGQFPTQRGNWRPQLLLDFQANNRQDHGSIRPRGKQLTCGPLRNPINELKINKKPDKAKIEIFTFLGYCAAMRRRFALRGQAGVLQPQREGSWSLCGLHKEPRPRPVGGRRRRLYSAKCASLLDVWDQCHPRNGYS